MKKKSVKAAFYAGAVILACFYLLVLWWGKNPDVGLEYRMYYLTHELSDWPGYGKLSYEPGTTEYCTTLKDKDGNESVVYVSQNAPEIAGIAVCVKGGASAAIQEKIKKTLIALYDIPASKISITG